MRSFLLMVLAVDMALPVLLPTQANFHNYIANFTEACSIDILSKPDASTQESAIIYKIVIAGNYRRLAIFVFRFRHR